MANMNGLVAAIKFLSETVVAGEGAEFNIAYQAGLPEAGTVLGSFVAMPGFLVGYYVLDTVSHDGTVDDDFKGYWIVTGA